MVEPGGVRDITDVKFLILYILKFCNTPITFTTLSDIIMYDGLADFFNFSSALAELVETGHVLKIESDNFDNYQCTELGEEAIALFQNRLKPSVRQKSVAAATLFLERERKTRQARHIKATFESAESGGFQVYLSFSENNDELISISLNVPYKEQARAICKHFKEDTSEIISGIFKVLAP